jgi:hypothetical protein
VGVALPPLDAAEVKRRADFVAIAGRYTKLRRVGRQYVGLCPFHRERHPSFYVEPDRKIFYCFGCGARGDVLEFIMRAEGCDFYRALELAQKLGGSERSPRAVFARGPSEQGAKPPLPAKQAAQIVRKPEPQPRPIPGLADWPSLDCAAERAASLLEKAG